MRGEPLAGSAAAQDENELRLRLAIEAANIGIWDWNPLTNDMHWSRRAKAIAGLSLDEPVTFQIVRDITHPDDHPWTSALARDALDPAVRRRDPYEYRIVRPDGEVRWVVANGEAIFDVVDGAERAVRYVGTLRDVTDRRRTEATLRDSEARLRLAIDAARLGIWAHDVAQDKTTISPEMRPILGLPEDRPFDAGELTYHAGDRNKVREAGAEALARGERFFQTEFRYDHPARGLIWLLVRAEILMDEKSQPRGAIGVVMDVTEQKAAEERQAFLLRELDHRVRNTIASVRSIASSTLRNSRDLAEAERALSERLAALGRVHTLLGTAADNGTLRLRDVVIAILEPHQSNERRIDIDGASAHLGAQETVALGMVVQELATNGAKYGALSVPEGRVEVSWTVDRTEDVPRLKFRWRERNGPTVVAPTRRGFGSNFIDHIFAKGFNARVERNFENCGLSCEIDMPLTGASS